MTETKTVVQGKWGFYPCSYELYQKIRRLYGYYLLALRRKAEHERWSRKDPKNRVIKKWWRDDKGRKCGYEIVGPKPEPKLVPIFTEQTKRKSWSGVDLGNDITIVNPHIESNYHRARYPKASEKDVIPLSMTEPEVDSMLSVLDKWKSEQ